MPGSVWNDREHPYWRAPRGRWLAADVPTTPPYPCRCLHPQPCPINCPCWGRPDTDLTPDTCCAARRAAQRQAREAA